jgi:hypothetical protein
LRKKKVRKIEENVEHLILTINKIPFNVLFKSQPGQEFQLSQGVMNRTFCSTKSYFEEEALKVARRQAASFS